MSTIDEYLLRKQVVTAGFTLDVSSAALQVGDWFCIAANDSTGNTVTKAVAAALALAGAPMAIATESAQPGQTVRGIPIGMVPASVSELGAGAVGAVRIDTATARTERVTVSTVGDYVVGVANAQGALTLQIGIGPLELSASATATHTSTGAAYETVAALTYTVPDGYTAEVMYRAVGRAGTDFAKYMIAASYTRLAGGATAEDWQTHVGGSPKEVDLVWDAQIVVSGNDIQFQVKANSDDPAWKLERTITVQAMP